jgi:hypothetical protein
MGLSHHPNAIIICDLVVLLYLVIWWVALFALGVSPAARSAYSYPQLQPRRRHDQSALCHFLECLIQVTMDKQASVRPQVCRHCVIFGWYHFSSGSLWPGDLITPFAQIHIY